MSSPSSTSKRIPHGLLVAQAIVDFRRTSDELNYVHLVHPKPISWSSIATVLSTELQLKIIPYNIWLEKLENECSANPQMLNAAFLPFFQVVTYRDPGNEGFGVPDIDYEYAVQASRALQEAAQVGKEDIRSWIEYWRSVRIAV